LDQLELTQHLDQVVYSLSEGQKKKLQILLMLISGQPILLLDEPLKGLDLESVQIILQLILQVRKATEQTIILISHQLTGLAGFIDYHVVFENQQLRYQESLS
jgi:energy-coupling factor transport system ATP-binding protein